MIGTLNAVLLVGSGNVLPNVLGHDAEHHAAIQPKHPPVDRVKLPIA